MRYLLIGNGPDKHIVAKISSANVFVQINSCDHSGLIPKGKLSYIFVTNTGGHSASIMSKIGYGNLVVIFARNPLFYSIKKYVLRILGSKSWQYFSVDKTPSGFQHINVIKSCRLELKLLREGMKLSYMPSTGAIAYHWIVRALQPGDSLDIAGFEFDGWSGHPWELEKQLIKPIERENMSWPDYSDIKVPLKTKIISAVVTPIGWIIAVIIFILIQPLNLFKK